MQGKNPMAQDTVEKKKKGGGDAPRPSAGRENAGIFHFVKDMGSALAMALVAIIYVIQAFKIPTSSMEKSLLIGDFLLGLKFTYGAPVLPFSYLKFPAVGTVKPGDVIIFEYPGNDNRDYIKRCVAGPGQTVELRGTTLTVDGKGKELPPHGLYVDGGRLRLPEISDFSPLRIPAKGDTLRPSELPVREFLFAKNLITQENPRNRVIKFLESFFLTKGIFRQNLAKEKVQIRLQLYLDGDYTQSIQLNEINKAPLFTTTDDWISLKIRLNEINHWAQSAYPGKQVAIYKMLTLDGKPLSEYVVQHDNYFMLGDNRDNSMDSRYWGYLNHNYIKAKAFILYFSWNGYRWCSQCRTYTAPDGHNYHYLAGRGGDERCDACHSRLDHSVPFYLKIRWNRIGMLIRSWDKTAE
jgi:signal peptidase I